MSNRLGPRRHLSGGQIAGQNGKRAPRDGIAAQPGHQPPAPGRAFQHRLRQPPPRPRPAAHAKAASDRMTTLPCPWSGTWARRSSRYWLRAAAIGEDVIGGRASLTAEDGECRNLHRSARTLPAARGHAGRITCRYDTASHSLNSRLCRVPAGTRRVTSMATAETRCQSTEWYSQQSLIPRRGKI